MMGPYGIELPEPPEPPAPGWWWQVLGADSREPVMGCGRADREVLARQLVEAQMQAAEGSLDGMTMGPGGIMLRCHRAANGLLHWTAGNG